MKCLSECGDKSGLCILISRINAVMFRCMDVVNGKERWDVCITYAGDGEWHEYYDDMQEATDRYNKLAEILMSY